MLSERHLKLRYRGSIFGFLWTLIYPLAATLVLTVVFSGVFAVEGGYALYALVGVLTWHFFSVSCLQASDALLGSSSIVRKVYVPTAVFPVSAVAANLANFVLCIAVLPVAFHVAGVAVAYRLGALGFAIAVSAIFTAGIALVLASLNVFFRDVRYFFEALMLVWFYATPIVYPADLLTGASALLVTLNPLYWVLAAVRSGVHPAYELDVTTAAAASFVATASLTAGWVVYHRCERQFYLYL